MGKGFEKSCIQRTAFIPQTTVVSPRRTKAEPTAVLIAPKKLGMRHNKNLIKQIVIDFEKMVLNYLL